MDEALTKVHKVFVHWAAGSPRFLSIDLNCDSSLDMQRQSYRMGSRSARVVAQRARAAEGMFLDFKAFGWCVSSATAFQVATWIRSRATDGTKTAASRAAMTIRVVQWATDWSLHLDHPLVMCQVKPRLTP